MLRSQGEVNWENSCCLQSHHYLWNICIIWYCCFKWVNIMCSKIEIYRKYFEKISQTSWAKCNFIPPNLLAKALKINLNKKCRLSVPKYLTNLPHVEEGILLEGGCWLEAFNVRKLMQILAWTWCSQIANALVHYSSSAASSVHKLDDDLLLSSA